MAIANLAMLHDNLEAEQREAARQYAFEVAVCGGVYVASGETERIRRMIAENNDIIVGLAVLIDRAEDAKAFVAKQAAS